MFTSLNLIFFLMIKQSSDLRNGLFLEQAAHCYLKLPRASIRKYAFHMIMAGHRFNRADQVRWYSM